MPTTTFMTMPPEPPMSRPASQPIRPPTTSQTMMFICISQKWGALGAGATA